MLKLIVVVVILIVLYIIWKKILKTKSNNTVIDEQNERPKLIQNKEIFTPKISENEHKLPAIDQEEQRLFDEVSHFFFNEKIDNRIFKNAEQIQHHFLKNMPASTLSQIEKHDLAEWSIYWSFGEQSLEYYVGKYGIFYAHVDRFGVEHKYEKLDTKL